MARSLSPKELFARNGLDSSLRDVQRFAEVVRDGWRMYSCGPPGKGSSAQEFLNLCVELSGSLVREGDSSSMEHHSLTITGLKRTLLFFCERALPPKGDGRLTCELDKALLAWMRLNTTKLLSICRNILEVLMPLETDSDLSCGWQRVSHVMKETAAILLYLVLVYSSNDYVWCTKSSCGIASELGKILCACCGVSSLKDLLNGRQDRNASKEKRPFPGPVFSDVMKLLQERLTREQWRCYPAAIEVLTWCLWNSKRDLLEEHVGMLMVPLLILVDEGEASIDLSLRGISGLTYLVDQVTSAELCRYNRVHVLCDALTRHMYSRNPTLLEQLLPLLLKVTELAQQSEQMRSVGFHNTPHVQWAQLNDVFDHLLTSAHSESRLVLRRVYLDGVLQALPRISGTIFLHTQMLIEVVMAFLEVPDPPEETARFTALMILHELIISTWPCVSAARNSQRLLQGLLKLLASSTVHSSELVAISNLAHLKLPEAVRRFQIGLDSEQSAVHRKRIHAIARKDLGTDQAAVGCLVTAATHCLSLLCRCSKHVVECVAGLRNGLPHHGVTVCLELASLTSSSFDSK